MAWLNVQKRFKLNLAEGVREFEAGIQEVEDEIAKHWFVQAHSDTLTAKQVKAIKAANADAEPEAAETEEQEAEAPAEPETPADQAPAAEA